MYEVIGFPRTRALRVTWLLEELGQPYRFICARPRSDLAYADNPTGKLPILKVDGEVVIDSLAICTFLADRHADKGLTFPAGTLERARMDSFLQLAVHDFELPLWLTSLHSRLLPEQHRVKEILPWAAGEWKRAVKALARRLGEGPYVMGERFTLADLFFGHIAGWARVDGLAIADETVSAYFARVSKRPALITALKREKAAAEASSEGSQSA